MSLDRNQVPAAHYAKHITVDVTNGGTGSRVGANLSSRMPIHVKGEGGNELHGFFTENETNNWKEIFAARARDMVNDPKNRLFAPLYQGAARKPRAMEDLMRNVIEVSGVSVQGKTTTAAIGAAMVTALKTSGTARAMFRDFVTRVGGDPDPLLEDANISAMTQYALKLLAIDGNARVMEGTHLAIHGQYLGTSVNKRNNAMSDYAELLGSPDLIAKSVPMTVNRGQQTVHGTFMANADGLDLDDFIPSRPGFSYLASTGVSTAKQMEIAPEGMKALSHLQVMDYLCGNVDRHGKNMFYKFDTSDPQKVRLVGVQGIDNDASFGMVEHTHMGPQGYMSGLADIKVMDAEQAKAILELTPEKMNEKIRLADLSEEEILAANQRLSDLKDRITRGQIDLIARDADWQKLTEPESFKRLSLDRGEDGANIFKIVDGNIEEYNRAPSSFSQKSYDQQPPMTFGKLISLQEDLSLAEQMNNLKAIREQARDAQEKIPGFGAVAEKAQEAIDVMEIAVKGIPEDQVAGFTMKQLKPADRNELAGLLQDLADTGNRFADTLRSKVEGEVLNKMNADRGGMKRRKSNEPSYALETAANDSDTVNAYRAARNMAAHAANAKQGVLTDSMEAEMQLASRMAQEIAARHPERKQAAPPKNRMDYDQLKAKLHEIDSRWIRSSSQFKDMLHAFNNLEKTQDYNALADKAKEYILYKDFNGTGNGLSDYAKARVQFARELYDWTKQRNEDGLTIANFSKSCQETLEQYRQAGSPEEKKQILQDYKEQFQTSYRQMLQISESYPKDRQMQTVCNSFFQNGPIKQYLHAVHSTLSPEEQKTTDIYQAAGLDSNDYFRGKQIENRQKQLESPVKGAKPVTNPNPQMSK